MSENHYSFHSSDVSMWLECERHERIYLSRITPQAVVVRTPVDLAACHADLVVMVDGREMRCRVHIAEGLSKDRTDQLALGVDTVAPF